jgi:hypothetical protein
MDDEFRYFRISLTFKQEPVQLTDQTISCHFRPAWPEDAVQSIIIESQKLTEEGAETIVMGIVGDTGGDTTSLAHDAAEYISQL